MVRAWGAGGEPGVVGVFCGCGGRGGRAGAEVRPYGVRVEVAGAMLWGMSGGCGGRGGGVGEGADPYGVHPNKSCGT